VAEDALVAVALFDRVDVQGGNAARHWVNLVISHDPDFAGGSGVDDR